MILKSFYTCFRIFLGYASTVIFKCFILLLHSTGGMQCCIPLLHSTVHSTGGMQWCIPLAECNHAFHWCIPLYIPLAFHLHFTCIPLAFHLHSTCIPLAFHLHSTCIPPVECNDAFHFWRWHIQWNASGMQQKRLSSNVNCSLRHGDRKLFLEATKSARYIFCESTEKSLGSPWYSRPEIR